MCNQPYKNNNSYYFPVLLLLAMYIKDDMLLDSC